MANTHAGSPPAAANTCSGHRAWLPRPCKKLLSALPCSSPFLRACSGTATGFSQPRHVSWSSRRWCGPMDGDWNDPRVIKGTNTHLPCRGVALSTQTIPTCDLTVHQSASCYSDATHTIPGEHCPDWSILSTGLMTQTLPASACIIGWGFENVDISLEFGSVIIRPTF